MTKKKHYFKIVKTMNLKDIIILLSIAIKNKQLYNIIMTTRDITRVYTEMSVKWQ